MLISLVYDQRDRGRVRGRARCSSDSHRVAASLRAMYPGASATSSATYDLEYQEENSTGKRHRSSEPLAAGARQKGEQR